jgi:deoxyribonuclease-4
MSIKNLINNYEEINTFGGNIIQVFISNPRSSKDKNLIARYTNNNIKEYIRKNKYKLVVHSPYVFNISKENTTIISLYSQLIVTSMIGAYGYVLHMGKSLDLNINDAKKYMYLTLKLLIKKIIEKKLKIIILLETSAGQGTELLTNLDDLEIFYNKFTNEDKKYLKICVDTCHIFSAGYDIRTKEQVKLYFEEFNKKIKKKNLGLIHLNDSKTVLNSNVDRHENIGKGKIGYNGLKAVVKYAYKNKIPIVLETPNNGYIKEIPWIFSNIDK